MMRRSIHPGSKPFNLISLFVLIIWMINMTQAEPPATGALTVVDNPDKTTQDSDGVSIEVESDGKQTYDRFVPTNEWKEVKEGQVIPPGLHVRMNVNTGKKEAKLLEKKDDGPKKEGKEGMLNKKQKNIDRKALEYALKRLKQPKFENEEDEISSTRATDISGKEFKSYNEVKDSFKKMKSAIKTEGEIVTNLHKKLIQYSDKEELRHILTELEYSLHKIDNALLFMDLGGISEIVKLLNSTDPDLRHDAAFVLGSALQSNSKVQIAAMEAGALQQLIKIVSTDLFMYVRKKSLYALSTMLRNFPYAQKRFLALGGLSVFYRLFGQPHSEKMQIQVITLLSDLRTEQMFSSSHFEDGTREEKEKFKQYEEIDILGTMVRNGWCNKIKSLLAIDDYDTQEKILGTMNQFAAPCRSSFRSVRSDLRQLMGKYDRLCKEDTSKDSSTNNYFCLILSTISGIVLTVENIRGEL